MRFHLFEPLVVGKSCDQFPPGPHRWWHWRTYRVVHWSNAKTLCGHCNELLDVR